ALAGSGFWKRKLHLIERALFLAAAVTLIFPGVVTDGIGLAILVGMWFLQKRGQTGTPA
ncbi:MAG: hypothetical protein GX310_06130, partial [Synergistaceae bacterium]|nr:hypothetical protein [Synergistaceae bacterium]